MDYIVNNWDAILQALLAGFGTLAMVARLTPTPKDDAFFGKVYDIISKLTPNDRDMVKKDQVK